MVYCHGEFEFVVNVRCDMTRHRAGTRLNYDGEAYLFGKAQRFFLLPEPKSATRQNGKAADAQDLRANFLVINVRGQPFVRELGNGQSVEVASLAVRRNAEMVGITKARFKNFHLGAVSFRFVNEKSGARFDFDFLRQSFKARQSEGGENYWQDV